MNFLIKICNEHKGVFRVWIMNRQNFSFIGQYILQIPNKDLYGKIIIIPQSKNENL